MSKSYVLRKSVIVFVKRPFLETTPNNIVAASEVFANPSGAGSLICQISFEAMVVTFSTNRLYEELTTLESEYSSAGHVPVKNTASLTFVQRQTAKLDFGVHKSRPPASLWSAI